MHLIRISWGIECEFHQCHNFYSKSMPYLKLCTNSRTVNLALSQGLRLHIYAPPFSYYYYAWIGP
jgi:hypothetical protein